MHDPAIATAADYADAMLTARRAKNVFVLILLLMLLTQLTLFFLIRFNVINLGDSTSTTQPVSTQNALHYLSSFCLFLGVTGSIALSFILLLIVNIMLVGRLIGVARVTSAYLWCLCLLLLLFPWQAFLDNAGLTMEKAPFKLPGVLYTWAELQETVKFADSPLNAAMMKWARFAVLPFVAVIMLLVIQVKSNRGMRQALGEDEPVSPEMNA